MNSGNPLGRFAEPVSALVAVGVIFAAVGIHVFEALSGTALNTTFIDNVALIAVGVLFGGKAVANGAKEAIREPIQYLERDIHAAHKRLDALDAPPAKDGEGMEG